jgi:glycosyltransferase involved in cell wall biosynthesis
MSLFGGQTMSKIRVLEIVEATSAGTRRHVTDLVSHLDPSRFSVSLICSTLREKGFLDDIRLMRDRGVEVIVIQMVRNISPLRDLIAYFQILRVIGRGRFDVVHTHSSKAGFLGRLAARVTGVRIVIHTPHTFAFEMGVGRIKQGLYRRLEQFAARFTDTIICVCQREADSALKAGLALAGKFTVIENGLPEEAFTELGDKVAARRMLGLGADEPLVGMVGRFEPQKGHLDLVRAAPRVIQRFPNVRFALVGEGSKLSAVQRLIERLDLERHFVLPGVLENSSALYPAFDVFALPSLWESLPYSLLEAMAAGKAIVATSVGGMPGAITDGETGRLVPPDSPESLASAIVDLLANPDQRRSFGAAARERARVRYRLDNMVSKVEDLYTIREDT